MNQFNCKRLFQSPFSLMVSTILLVVFVLEIYLQLNGLMKNLLLVAGISLYISIHFIHIIIANEHGIKKLKVALFSTNLQLVITLLAFRVYIWMIKWYVSHSFDSFYKPPGTAVIFGTIQGVLLATAIGAILVFKLRGESWSEAFLYTIGIVVVNGILLFISSLFIF